MAECPGCEKTFDSMDRLVDHRTDTHDAYTAATTGAATVVEGARDDLQATLDDLEDEYGEVAVEAALSLVLRSAGGDDDG